MSDTWTIGQLAERAAETLRPTSQQPDGRVRDVPNERLIRWYTTIGLLDPPLTRRGRVALYGRRHLLQLIAVKRRQAEGRSIADIQEELAGVTDTTLESIARRPAAAGETGSELPPARPRFWAERPASASGAARTGLPSGAVQSGLPSEAAHAGLPSEAVPAVLPAGAVRPGLPSGAPAARPPVTGTSTGSRPAAHMHGVRLAPGVTLLLEGRTPSHDDVAALREAAEPVLAALRARNLTEPGHADPNADRSSGGSTIRPEHPVLDPSEGMH